MNVDLGIKLQAHHDGELTGREAQEIAALVENNAEAKILFNELQQTRALLKGNEPEFRLPESREFFWSKIEREISREDVVVAETSPAWVLFLRRHLAAVGGVAVAACLAVFAMIQMSPSLLEE